MLDRHVRGFLLHRESEGRSSQTISMHARNLSAFAAWLRAEGLPTDPLTWDATLVRSYFAYLRDRRATHGQRLKPSSIRNYANSILAFCRWLFAEELVPRDIVARVSAPRIPTLVKEPFDPSEVRRLLVATKLNKRTGRRDQALLLFMLDTGCRAGEVVSIRNSDVLWNQRLVKVFGKGGKERVVFVSAETMKAIQRYTSHRQEHSHGFLFTTEEGRQLTVSGLRQAIQRIAVGAEVSGAHPHRFRHTFAISFLRSGGNVLALQRMLGHSTIAMTQRYVAMVTEDLALQHEKHSPVQSLMRNKARFPAVSLAPEHRAR